jgi:chromosome segregation ATPase
MEEMVGQMAYKDSRIVEMDAEIHQLNQAIMDLKENIVEKDEVIRGRDQAIQIIRSTLVERTAERDRLQSAQVESPTAVSQSDKDNAYQEVLDSLQQRLLQINEQLAARDKSVEQISNECRLKDQSIAESLALQKALEEKCGSLEQNCTVLNQSYAQLYQNYIVLVQNQRDADNASDGAQRERQFVEEQRANLERRCLELEQQLGAVEQSRATLERTCAESLAVREQLQRALDDLDARHAEQKLSMETLVQTQASLEQSHAALEHNYMQLQMKHIELEQSHAAAVARSVDFDAVQKKCDELERRNVELSESCSKLERSLAAGRSESAAATGDTLPASGQLAEQNSLIDQLKKDAEAGEARFSKFKALAGSKIKALEKELEDVKQV